VVTTLASFSHPEGIAVDSSGNVYVSDNQMIREISSGGVVSTLAGQAGVTGATNGTGTAALFSYPKGVAVDSLGNVYVGDSGNHLIRVITPGGEVSTLAGQAGVTGSANGTGTAASFNSPRGVAVDSSGNVYVADGNNHMIRVITPGGECQPWRVGLHGVRQRDRNRRIVQKSMGSRGRFLRERLCGGHGKQSDPGNHPRRGGVNPGGSGSMGSANGTGIVASFFAPFGVAVDDSCVVYVGDAGNNLIRKIQ